ncbi:MAG: hypothetical protein WBX25_20925 [Rhodomicrobium sp.]
MTNAAFVSPDWDSDRIRAARDVLGIDATVFQFHAEIRSENKAPSVTSGTVILAADFIDVAVGEVHQLDDFGLRRTLCWSAAQNIIDNQSYYWQPAFRIMELANRQRLSEVWRKFADKSTQSAPLDNPYWVEQEFAAQLVNSAPLVASTSSGYVDWQLADRVVARSSEDGYAFSAAERKALTRYLSRRLDLHPQIRAAIVASGKLPRRIELVRWQPFAQGLPAASSSARGVAVNESTKIITFSQLNRTKVTYPLPSGLTASISKEAQGATAESKAQRSAVEAIAGFAQPAKPSCDDVLDHIKSACVANHPLEAILVFFMFSQQYGWVMQSDKKMAERVQELMPILRRQLQSPAAAEFKRASDLAGLQGEGADREKAAEYLVSATSLDSLPFGTFRFVTLANLVRGSRDVSKWEKKIWEKIPSLVDCYCFHIARYPWASNVFKDLGDLWYHSFNTRKAWEAWDLGRAVDPHWKEGAMNSILQMENKLRVDIPDNF